ncbi:hypothetical protein EMCRGX_G029627 [Ephydatia muelleri]
MVRSAALATELRKHNSNDAKCSELGWSFQPRSTFIETVSHIFAGSLAIPEDAPHETWLDFDERLFYSSPLEDTGVCKYSFSHILHVVHSEQEGEPEVDDNASNDQGDAYDEVLVQD